jgi:DNA replication protein DnaC
MIKGYHSNIMQIYEKIREEEAAKLTKRKAELESKLPQVFELESKIGKLSVELSLSIFKGLSNQDEYISTIKNKITNLRVQKTELLVANGYSTEYLSMQYKCNNCKDTGYIGTNKCMCYKQKLVQLYYKNSELNEILKENNFDNFSIDYYSSRKTGDEPESPRKNMEKILSKSMSFIRGFPAHKDNLLFYGNSGTGKTFLSHCIAKELLDKGHLVVYRTAEELIQNLRSIRFDNDNTLEELLVDCELLIIDDLGTEQINDFSKTELFNILNKKLLRQRKMLVSTNYTLKELSKTYSERITSRLFGSFGLCKFYGDDIRVKKNLASIK